jgi:hypothetical protein
LPRQRGKVEDGSMAQHFRLRWHLLAVFVYHQETRKRGARRAVITGTVRAA